MVENFAPLQQPLGSKSCLSTAIASILLYLGFEISLDLVSEWCHEDLYGCVPDLAIEALRDNDLHMERVGTEQVMRALVDDPHDPTPVIALLKPDYDHITDHAVVVLGFLSDSQGDDYVIYMDPQFGKITSMLSARFLYYWEHTGRDAFFIIS